MPKDPYDGKLKTAAEALAPIRSGMHVFVGSGAGEPQHLVEALAAKAPELSDTEVLHVLTLGAAPYSQPKFEGHLRHNALFIGPNVREAVRKGLADYTPCFLSEVPNLLRTGRLGVDAALIQVTPPDRAGSVSLGVAVDVVKAASEAAGYVVAQVNPRMPWTHGDSLVLARHVDAFVLREEPILELRTNPPADAARAIAGYVGKLIEDGSTLQVGIGGVPDAAVEAFLGKKDLGVHSEMISDGVLKLWRAGVLTGKRKTLHPGKIVTSFCMGTEALYRAVDDNPVFEFHPSDYVNAPSVIAQNDRMVSINSALQIDLTGQVGADSIGTRLYSGVGGQVDFIRGAALSRGGRSIIALPATARKGSVSRIVACLSEGTGVVTTRADIDFVVTEYGIASLKGRSLRERAVALIQIAHPAHRAGLIAAAKRSGYLDAGHVLPAEAGAYRADLEARLRFGELEVFFRPLKPSDERRLKDLFYSQSRETTVRRFGVALKRLSEAQFQRLVCIDYRTSMAVGGWVREGGRERLIAVGRYFLNPDGKSAEAAFTVHDDFQGRGIGTFLVDYLAWIGRGQGLEAFTAEVLAGNAAMLHVLEGCFRRLERRDYGADGVSLTARLQEWRGRGNPASAQSVRPAAGSRGRTVA